MNICVLFPCSISIEDAAREEEDKLKEAEKILESSVKESPQSDDDDDVHQMASDCKDEPKTATEEMQGATAATPDDDEVIFKVPEVPPQSGSENSGVVLNKDVIDELAQLSAIEKKIDKIQVDSLVAEETLAQLTNIEDKMNQLCSAANSLLKRKRFLTSDGKDGKKEKLDGEEEEVAKKDGDGRVKNTTDVEDEKEENTDPIARTDEVDDVEEASGKTKDDLKSTDVCDVKRSPMESVLDSVDPRKEEVFANGAKKDPADAETMDVMEDRVHKTGSEYRMLA